MRRFDETHVTVDDRSGALAPGPWPDSLLIPSEQILLLVVDLPLPSHRKRLEALPFAIEDQIGEPLESVHVALGSEIGPRRHIVAVVRHALMRGWVAQAEAAGMANAALVPDALALTPPAPDGWAVKIAAGRAVVRTGDGGGFALPQEHLALAWQAAGKPACIALGEPLPPEFGVADERGSLPEQSRAPVLDLRQGPYVRRAVSIPTHFRRLAIVLGGGMLAHGAVAVADTVALGHIAKEREDETYARVALAAPGLHVGRDIAAAATDLLPSADGENRDRFLPLLARTSAALAPLEIGLNGLSFSTTDGSLALDLDVTDEAQLDRIRAMLDSAGLRTSSVKGRIIVREAA